MQMGTGKTKTALDIVKGKVLDFDKLVWITNASLLEDKGYRQEILNRSQGLEKDIIYFTIEGISQSDFKYLELLALVEKYKCFCIVDESLSIKNSDAKRTKRLLDLWDKFVFRLVLNGTPVSRSLTDLKTQIDFIHPHILNMTEAQFAHTFLEYIDDGYRPWRRWSKPANEEALIAKIKPYIFDADLDILVDLISYDIDTPLNEDEKENYDKDKEDLLSQKEMMARYDFLSIAQKLQSSYTFTESKIENLKKLLSDGRQTIIFVKFIHEIDRLKDIFKGKCLEYSGRAKDDLTQDKQVVIITYGTGSKGLSMQHISRIIFFTQTFDWAQKEHALHRVYRTGQKNDVDVYNFWCDTGLEKLIRGSLVKKKNLANSIKEYIEARKVVRL